MRTPSRRACRDGRKWRRARRPARRTAPAERRGTPSTTANAKHTVDCSRVEHFRSQYCRLRIHTKKKHLHSYTFTRPLIAHAAISPWVTASHSNSEVKQGRVSAVPAWGTSWEGDMLHVFALLLHVFCSFRWLRSFSGHTSSNGNRDRIYFCTLTLTFRFMA